MITKNEGYALKNEYTSQELPRLPDVTYDTLRTWAGRRNGDARRKGIIAYKA